MTEAKAGTVVFFQGMKVKLSRDVKKLDNGYWFVPGFRWVKSKNRFAQKPMPFATQHYEIVEEE